MAFATDNSTTREVPRSVSNCGDRDSLPVAASGSWGEHVQRNPSRFVEPAELYAPIAGIKPQGGPVSIEPGGCPERTQESDGQARPGCEGGGR